MKNILSKILLVVSASLAFTFAGLSAGSASTHHSYHHAESVAASAARSAGPNVVQGRICANSNSTLCWQGGNGQLTLEHNSFSVYHWSFFGHCDGTSCYYIRDAHNNGLQALPNGEIVTTSGLQGATVWGVFVQSSGAIIIRDESTGQVGEYAAVYRVSSGFKLWTLGKSGHSYYWRDGL